MNILLTNTAVNNGNRGCVALSVSVMALLKEVLESEKIPYTFLLPQSGFSDVAQHSIGGGNVEPISFRSIQNITTISMLDKARNIRNYSDYRESCQMYNNADVIMDIGIGDSFSDIYGLRRFNSVFTSYRYAMRKKKPFCILPQTIGPFTDEKVRKQAIEGIEYASRVMVRDKQSYEYVKELLPDKEVIELIDVAFFMPYTRKSFASDFIHVGLNVSGLLWHGGYTMDNQFNLKVNYQKLIREILTHFLAQDNVKVHLIPHVVGTERNIENDYAVSYDLVEEYQNENLLLAPLFLDPISAKGYIAGMDFFMGARMHSSIAAFSSGVPVVPMAYSRKFNGLFADTLGYPNVADMKANSEEDVMATIKECFENREEKKSFIKDRMVTKVADMKLLLLEHLKQFLLKV